MNRSPVYAAALLILTVSSAPAQEELLGTWEMADEEESYLYHFRDDGIVFENDYHEGDLDCVSVYPYTVEDGEVTFGLGLSWFVDFDSGELVLDEFGEESEPIVFGYQIDDDELTLKIDNAILLREMLDGVDDDFDLSPEDVGAGDLDLDDEDLQVSDELLRDVLETSLIYFLAEELGVDFGDVEELTTGLDEAVSLLDEQIDSLGKGVFARSDRAVVVPPGIYTLPNGITAIEAQSWGQVKKAFSR